MRLKNLAVFLFLAVSSQVFGTETFLSQNKQGYRFAEVLIPFVETTLNVSALPQGKTPNDYTYFIHRKEVCYTDLTTADGSSVGPCIPIIHCQLGNASNANNVVCPLLVSEVDSGDLDHDGNEGENIIRNLVKSNEEKFEIVVTNCFFCFRRDIESYVSPELSLGELRRGYSFVRHFFDAVDGRLNDEDFNHDGIIDYFSPDDVDLDDILNEGDNCPTVANPDQANTYGDERGDACETRPDPTNPPNPCEGVSCPQGQQCRQTSGQCEVVPPPPVSRCANACSEGHTCDENLGVCIPNPPQPPPPPPAGNLCENKTCPQGQRCKEETGECVVTGDPYEDRDDGIPFEKDNCPGTYNPDQTDSDKDGLGDACDLEHNPSPTSKSNPPQTDSGKGGGSCHLALGTTFPTWEWLFFLAIIGTFLSVRRKKS